MYDLIVVGAGPSGCRVASRAAGSGWRTLLLEEHEEVGLPVHCTGIVGQDMLTAYRLPERLVVGEVDPFVVLSPQGRRYALPRVKAWLLDRRELDLWLAGQAAAAGARLESGCSVTEVTQVGHSVEVAARSAGRPLRLKARAVVLATGAMTNLPSRAGLQPPAGFYRTAQVAGSVRGLRGAELHLGRRLAPGSFAYAVSAREGAARVGVISRSRPRQGLQRLLEELRTADRLGEVGPPVCRRIPMGQSPQSVRGRVLGVGDTVGQAKTTTGGGLYYGLLCADLLADVLGESRSGGDFRPEGLAGYDSRWKRRLAGELRVGRRVRRIFERVEDPELEELLGLLERPDVCRVIAERGHFDAHGPLLTSLAALPSVRLVALGVARRCLSSATLFRNLFQAMGRCLPAPDHGNLGRGLAG